MQVPPIRISKTPVDGPDLLKSNEVCALGRLSIATLNRYIRTGKITPIYLSARTRRFYRGEIYAFFGLNKAFRKAEEAAP